MMMNQASTTPLQRTKAKARANCALGWHRWHPTFTLGEKVCVVCGLYTYCPRCLSRLPSDARLVLCALHQSEEQRKEEA